MSTEKTKKIIKIKISAYISNNRVRSKVAVKRFITYLYECKNGYKIKNIGFLRMDIRNQVVNMQISIRNLELGDKRGIFYFIVQDKKVYGIEMGKLLAQNGQCNARFSCSCRELGGSSFLLEDVIGVGLRFEGEYYAASNWKEEENEVITRGDFVVYGLEEKTTGIVSADTEVIIEETVVQETDEEETYLLAEEKIQAASVEEKKHPIELQIEESNEGAQQKEIPTGNTQSLAEAENNSAKKIQNPTEVENNPKKNIQSSSEVENNQAKNIQNSSELENNLAKKTQNPTESENNQAKQLQENQIEENLKMSVTENDTEISYYKMNLNEIYALPSKYWQYSNNSFLIHGFWNYGYLVLKEEMENGEKRISLGVPGIFETPEMVMAKFFGFPQFEALPSEVVEVVAGESYAVPKAEKNQQPKEGLFGCWFVTL